MLNCVECGKRIRDPLSEQQIVSHIVALLEDTDRNVAKLFAKVFTLDKNEHSISSSMFSRENNDVTRYICPHCSTMHYIEWLSSYEIPLRFWMSVMALPSIALPFVLQVRQFADARTFPSIYVHAMKEIKSEFNHITPEAMI